MISKPCREARLVPAALFFLLGAAGCGNGLSTVRGTVNYEDGTAVPNGMVIFESKGDKPITARGTIQDGKYELSTKKPGDGVPPGEYRVMLAPQVDLNDADKPAAKRGQAPFDKRYMEFKTSGLEFEVKPGANEYPIKVTRPGKGTR